jgi:hypothetical protein
MRKFFKDTKSNNGLWFSRNFIPFLIIFTLLIYNDSLFFGGLLVEDILIKSFLFFLVFFISLLYLIYKNISINFNLFFFYLFLVILLFFTMILNNDFTGGYFSIITVLTISVLVAHVMPLNRFIEVSVKVILFLSIYSLLIYVFRPLLFNYNNFFPYFINEADTPFLHFGFSVFVYLPYYYRIFGLFRESGVYQIFLNFALFFILFKEKSKSKLVFSVPILLTLILTFSIPGYIGSSLLLLAFFFANYKLIKSKIFFHKTFQFLLFLLIIVLFIVVFYSNFLDDFSDAILKLVNRESSYNERTVSILVEFELWLKKPFFGYGITDGIAQSKALGELILGYPLSNTSTITGLMVTLGVIFTSFITFSYVRFFTDNKIPFISNILIIVAMVFIISSQLIMYNAYLYSIIFFSFLKKQDSSWS